MSVIRDRLHMICLRMIRAKNSEVSFKLITKISKTLHVQSLELIKHLCRKRFLASCGLVPYQLRHYWILDKHDRLHPMERSSELYCNHVKVHLVLVDLGKEMEVARSLAGMARYNMCHISR